MRASKECYFQTVSILEAQASAETIDSFVTSLRLLAKLCKFGDQELLIRDRMVIDCVGLRLQERLLREVDLNLLKALNICRAAEATKEQVKFLQASSIPVSLATAVYVVNNNASGISIRDKNIGCHCCGCHFCLTLGNF